MCSQMCLEGGEPDLCDECNSDYHTHSYIHYGHLTIPYKITLSSRLRSLNTYWNFTLSWQPEDLSWILASVINSQLRRHHSLQA